MTSGARADGLLLEGEGLTKSFGALLVLDGVDFLVGAGEAVAFERDDHIDGSRLRLAQLYYCSEFGVESAVRSAGFRTGLQRCQRQ